MEFQILTCIADHGRSLSAGDCLVELLLAGFVLLDQGFNDLVIHFDCHPADDGVLDLRELEVDVDSLSNLPIRVVSVILWLVFPGVKVNLFEVDMSDVILNNNIHIHSVQGQEVNLVLLLLLGRWAVPSSRLVLCSWVRKYNTACLVTLESLDLSVWSNEIQAIHANQIFL